MANVEIRYFPFSHEIRSETETDTNQITSYSAVFNVWSNDLWGFREIIRPGTFANTIINDDIRCLFNHDVNLILGRNKAGTLHLIEDDKGLKYTVDLPATSYAQDLKQSVLRGDISQNSFWFETISDRWGTEEIDGQKWEVRELLEVQLFDVSPVTYPAYPGTDGINVRGNPFFNTIALKSKRNLPFTDQERSDIQKQITYLQGLLGNKTGVSSRSDSIKENIIDRQLELMSKKVKIAGGY